MRFETTVESTSSPSEIWSLFVDVEKWPSLTPSMKRVELLEPGPFKVGSAARVRQPGTLPTFWRVTEVDDGRSFTWFSRTTGVKTVATHTVEPTDGGSRVTLALSQTGLLSPIVGLLIGRRVRRWIHLEAQGFASAADRGGRPQ